MSYLKGYPDECFVFAASDDWVNEDPRRSEASSLLLK